MKIYQKTISGYLMISSKDIGLSEDVTYNELGLSENITDNDPGLFKEK